ncbi:MAG: MBL fold metallo-hydrolase [Deltaproteobacteria bacterium]|nr:MAG: MBL fold metallo-hydrolase [Deltaproteobacteria bacterium]
MKTVFSVVCDNTAGESRFLGEHGWSCLIERGSQSYLFDTGQGIALPHNLKGLDSSLKGLRHVFISHGHYDHTGGLKTVLQEIGGVEIIAHPEMFAHHSVKKERPEKTTRYIGCPFTKSELVELGGRFNFIDETKEVLPGIWFVTGIDRDPDKVPNDSRLVVEKGGNIEPDPIEDDASLLVETDKGLVLILGCAHSGIINILDFLRNNMGIDRLCAVMGGTHLAFCSSEILPQVIEKLEAFSIDLVGVSHCTGFESAAIIYGHFQSRFSLASAGKSFTI